MPHNKLAGYINAHKLFQEMVKLYTFVNKMEQDYPNDSVEQSKHIMSELNKLQIFMLNSHYNQANSSSYEYKKIEKNFGQHLNEIVNELHRIEAVVNYYRYKNEAQKACIDVEKRLQLSQLLTQLDNDLIQKVNQYNQDVKKRVEGNFNKLNSFIKVNVTLNQGKELVIMKPIELKQGYWYKCPRGHVYTIGGYTGAAMQTFKCPNCPI